MRTIRIFLVIFIGYLGSVMILHAESSTTHQTVFLSIPKMNCSMCPIMIKKVLGKVDGVLNIDVSLERKTATVEFDEAKTTIDTILQATKDVGYPSSILTNLKEK